MRLRIATALLVTALAAAVPLSAQAHDAYEASSASEAFAAYFADGTSDGLLGMQALADPHPLTGEGSNMELVANVPLEGSVAASDLELQGDYAYVGSYGEGLVIIDIANPREPKRVSRFYCPGGQNDVQLSPDASYAVLAVENPNNKCGEGIPGQPKHAGDEGFVVIDIRDKTNPKEVAWVGQDQLVDGVHNVTLDWPRLYIDQYTQTHGRFEIFDLSNPAQPRSIAKLAAPEGGPHDLQVDHRPDGRVLAYAASIAFTHVLDVTDPTNPTFVDRIPASEHGVGISHGAEPNFDRTLMVETDEYGGGNGVVACGGRVEQIPAPTDGQVATASPGAVHLIRLNPDGTLKEVGGKVDQVGAYNTPAATTDTGDEGCTSHVFWQAPDENRLTIAWYGRGVRVVDFSKPEAPVELGYFKATGADTWSAKPHKGYIFAGDIVRGLDVFRYTGEDCKRWPTTAGAAEVQRARYQGAPVPAGAPAKVPGGCGAAATNAPAVPLSATPGPATKDAAAEFGGYRFMRVVKVKRRGGKRRRTVRLQILDPEG
ncbi:MAG TPA: hypothetical protein VF533_03220, partial [Solirubrobacteraceae bacterium]